MHTPLTQGIFSAILFAVCYMSFDSLNIVLTKMVKNIRILKSILFCYVCVNTFDADDSVRIHVALEGYNWLESLCSLQHIVLEAQNWLWNHYTLLACGAGLNVYFGRLLLTLCTRVPCGCLWNALRLPIPSPTRCVYCCGHIVSYISVHKTVSCVLWQAWWVGLYIVLTTCYNFF